MGVATKWRLISVRVSVTMLWKRKREIGEEKIQFEVLEEEAFQIFFHVTKLTTLYNQVRKLLQKLILTGTCGLIISYSTS